MITYLVDFCQFGVKLYTRESENHQWNLFRVFDSYEDAAAFLEGTTAKIIYAASAENA